MRKKEPISFFALERKNSSWVKYHLPKTVKDKLERLPFKDKSLRGFQDD